MFVGRHPTKLKYYKKLILITDRQWLPFLIVLIAFGGLTSVNSLQRTGLNDFQTKLSDCETRRTCTECTEVAPTCKWSLIKQSCIKTMTKPTTTMPSETTSMLSETTSMLSETTSILSETTSMLSETITISSKMITRPLETTTMPLTTTTRSTEQQQLINSTESIMTTEKQELTDSTDVHRLPLTIYDVESCPKFSISYNKSTNHSTLYYTIKVNVSNDPTEQFKALLNQSVVTCHLNEMVFPNVTNADDQITCEFAENQFNYSLNGVTPSAFNYFSISINNVSLKFDNKADHYISVYNNDCYSKQQLNAECVNCFWDDDKDYRYYCRWCSANDKCTGLRQHCDVRQMKNNSYSGPKSVENVQIQCPAIQIESIEPMYGPCKGGTTVRIAVSNNKMLSEQKLTKVTVAGSRCLLPTLSQNGIIITCTISPINSSQLNEGPVEVMYVSNKREKPYESLPTLTLQSKQMFYFVDPEIINVQPLCGSMAGGTQLNIRGNFLNAGNTLKVSVRENISCAITSHTQNDVTCVTGPSDTPSMGKVKLEFDNYLNKYVPNTLFRYIGEPAVDGGQTFKGIASGGTKLPVWGRYFTCIENPLIYVSYNGIRHTSGCHVHNDTYMVCKTPTINRPAPNTIMSLLFGFQADFDKKILQLRPPQDSLKYLLYPDPVYIDFDTDGDRTVTIYGLHMNQGYYLSDDLLIQIQESTVVCNVISVKSKRIVCQTPSQPSSGGGSSRVGPELAGVAHDEIVVTLGNLVYDVKRKPTFRSSRMHLTVFLIAITLISLIITIVVAIVYCLKIALMTSSQQTEMQSLCEHLNSTASVTTATKKEENIEKDNDIPTV